MGKPALHDVLVGRVHVTQDFDNVWEGHYPGEYPWLGRHHGVDLAMRTPDATQGRQIHAPDDGKILRVFNDNPALGKANYRGNAVEWQTDEGIWDFFHMGAKPTFKVGDVGPLGTVLGNVGATGDAKNNLGQPLYHLHFGFRELGNNGAYRDPLRQYGRRLCEAKGFPWLVYQPQIVNESGWRSLEYSPSLISWANAKGIAQIVEQWHPGAGDVWNPFTALTYSVSLMVGHLTHYNDIERALAAYNAGRGIADKPKVEWSDGVWQYVRYATKEIQHDEPPTQAARLQNMSYFFGEYLRATPNDKSKRIRLEDGTLQSWEVIFDRIANKGEVVR